MSEFGKKPEVSSYTTWQGQEVITLDSEGRRLVLSWDDAAELASDILSALARDEVEAEVAEMFEEDGQ
jgi:hypothetical protein